MARKKKIAPEAPENASESALIKTRSCTINLCINLDARKLKASIEDRGSGHIYDASAELEER